MKSKVETTGTLLGLAFCVALALSAEPGAQAQAPPTTYLTYDTFRAITRLSPEVKNARLESLTAAAQELWSHAQLKVPELTNVFVGDFNHDGKEELAITITDGARNYVSIVEQIGSRWQRRALVRAGKAKLEAYNGRALVLGDQDFVAWNGTSYERARGPLALYCYGYAPADLSGVMVKLTYVGEQDKPYPGLLFASYRRWPDLAAFSRHRKSGISYGNDDSSFLWHAAFTTDELREFALLLNRSKMRLAAEDRTVAADTVTHSLSIIDTASSRRPNYYEILLTGPETSMLTKAFAATLTKRNADATTVLREYARLFSP